MTYRLIASFTLLLATGYAQAQAILTQIEGPVRLIRGAAVYKGAAGVPLQREDIIETGAAGVQIEAGKDTIVALGPQTRVFVQSLAQDDKSATELAVLRGWIKLQSQAPRRAVVTTPMLQLTLPQGSTIFQIKPSGDALFAEAGAQQVARIDAKGKAGAPVKLAVEQFAFADPVKQQLLVGRPGRDFLSTMPRPFRDRLVQAPPVAKAGKVAPLKERDVSFEDVDDWMLSSLPVRRNFVSRFKSRLTDPDFRAALDGALGQSPEWRFILRPSVVTGSTIY